MLNKSYLMVALSLVAASSYANQNTIQATQLKQLEQQVNKLDQMVAKEHSRYVNHGSKTMTHLIERARHRLTMDNAQDVYFEMLPHTTFGTAVAQAMGEFSPESVHLGGMLEGDAQYWHSPARHSQSSTYSTNGSALRVTTANLDVMANINPWAAVYTSLSVDSSYTSQLNQAFVILGNLKKNPIYAIAGKTYLPFGVFAGAPYSPSLSKSIFRPGTTNQLDLSYDHNGLNTNLAVFNTPTRNQISDLVYSFYYNNGKNQPVSYSVGAGYLNDIRGLTSDLGASTKSLAKRIGLWDLHASATYKLFTLSGELTQTTRAVPKNHGHGRAIFTALSYAPTLMHKVTTFAVGYNQTSNLEGVPTSVASGIANVPSLSNGVKRMLFGYVSRNILKNFVGSIEYVRNTTYSGKLDSEVTLDGAVYL